MKTFLPTPFKSEIEDQPEVCDKLPELPFMEFDEEQWMHDR